MNKKYFTLIFLLFLTSDRIFSDTFNTITDAGTGYGGTWSNAEEQFTRSDGQGLKLTWDSDEVFIEVSGNNEHFIYFSGSSGTTTGKNWDIAPTLPFNAQYVIILQPWDGGQNVGYEWNSSDWNTAISVDYIAHHNSDKAKTVKINTSALGSQSSIKWCAFAKSAGNGNWVGGYVPSDASSSGNPASTDSEVLTKYYEYSSSVWLQASKNPNGSDYSLPVELTLFSADPTRDGNILLQWETASEIDNLGFILERKTDIEHWFEIANYITHPELQGQGSVSYSTRYQYTDESAIGGSHYDYRLADVDISGNKTYHDLEVLGVNPFSNILDGFHLNSIYPNPFNPEATIQFSMGEASFISIFVYDMKGRLVNTLANEVFSIGTHSIKWDGLTKYNENIPSGIYFINFQLPDRNFTQKISFIK